MTEKEVYIHTYNGLLRDGEYIYSDTTIVTPFADYYIEKYYEVEYDTISIKMKKINYLDQGGGSYVCNEPPKTSWISDYNISPPINCPPSDTTLNNTFGGACPVVGTGVYQGAGVGTVVSGSAKSSTGCSSTGVSTETASPVSNSKARSSATVKL